MVALQILVLSVWVRVLVWQQKRRISDRGFFFFLLNSWTRTHLIGAPANFKFVGRVRMYDCPISHSDSHCMSMIRTRVLVWQQKRRISDRGFFFFVGAGYMFTPMCDDYFSHLSSQAKKVRCQRMPFCGLSTQWFSSGKMSSCASTPRILAASKAAMLWLARMR